MEKQQKKGWVTSQVGYKTQLERTMFIRRQKEVSSQVIRISTSFVQLSGKKTQLGSAKRTLSGINNAIFGFIPGRPHVLVRHTEDVCHHLHYSCQLGSPHTPLITLNLRTHTHTHTRVRNVFNEGLVSCYCCKAGCIRSVTEWQKPEWGKITPITSNDKCLSAASALVAGVF